MRITDRNNHMFGRPANYSEQCISCKSFYQGHHICKILCGYCHDFHLKNELIDNLCPVMYPFAKEMQEKSSYECKNCKGEGSYL